MSTTKRSTPFYFGGAASCIAAMVVHPFDLTKVRLQNTKGTGNQQGMLSTMIKIARTEGAIQLYAGLSASILRQATYSTVRFGGYEKMKTYVAKGQDPTVFQLLIASSTAGAVGGACGNPGDVVNVRMQNNGQLPPQQRRNYKHAIDGVIRIAREEGITSLFRGFKDLLLRYSPLQDGLILHFTSSTLAGLVATTVCSPVDVIKTRIMTASSSDRKMSSFNIMSSMYKNEGMASFFKGWTPAFIRLAPQTIITFVVLEQFKKWHSTWHDRQLLVAKI
ncbi:unnamed protein product [Absidia cylindrospora]